MQKLCVFALVPLLCLGLFMGCGDDVSQAEENIEFLLSEGRFIEAIALAQQTLAEIDGTNHELERVIQRRLAAALMALAVVSLDENGKATSTIIAFMADWIEYDQKTGTTLQKIFQVMPAGLIDHEGDVTQARELLEQTDKSVMKVNSLGNTVVDDESRRAYQLLGLARLLEIGSAFFGTDILCNSNSLSLPEGDVRPDDPIVMTDADLTQFDQNIQQASADFSMGGIDADFLNDLSQALNEIQQDIDDLMALALPGVTRNQVISTYINSQFTTSQNPSCP